MTLRSLLWENPLLVRFARARLRRQQLAPLVAGVVLLAGGITYLGTEQTVRDGSAFTLLLLLQGALLFLAGAAQVAAAMAHARESGMLDFHRLTPQPPLGIGLGFLLGAPIREYVLFACTLPFSVYVVARGYPSLAGLLTVLVVLLAAGLLYHAMAALAAVLVPRARTAGAGVVALVVLLNLVAGGAHGATGALTVGPTYHQVLPLATRAPAHAPFYGAPLPNALLALLHQLPLFLFLFLAVVRRVRREGLPLYSRPQAAAFHAALAAILIGDCWGQPEAYPVQVVVYGLTAAALALALAVTPGPAAVSRGLVRARRRGEGRPPLWSDGAPNWAPLLFFSAVTALAGWLTGVSLPVNAAAGAGLQAGLVGATAVFVFGSARQYFGLRSPGEGRTSFLLFLALAWCGPWLLAGLLATRSGMGEPVRQLVSGLSPIFGIGLAAAAREPGISSLGGAAALAAGTVLALLFLWLRRGVERTVIQRAE
jgi:hypothetical protein